MRINARGQLYPTVLFIMMVAHKEFDELILCRTSLKGSYEEWLYLKGLFTLTVVHEGPGEYRRI